MNIIRGFENDLSASRPASKTATLLYFVVRYAAFILGAFVSFAVAGLFFFLWNIWPFGFTNPLLQDLQDAVGGFWPFILAAPICALAGGWQLSKRFSNRYVRYSGLDPTQCSKIVAGVVLVCMVLAAAVLFVTALRQGSVQDWLGTNLHIWICR